jgi:hypothetical protein
VKLIRREAAVASGAAERTQDGGRPQSVRLELDKFAWDALTEQSIRLRVSPAELARFSVLYYLADLDSGRIARRLPRTTDRLAGFGA